MNAQCMHAVPPGASCKQRHAAAILAPTDHLSACGREASQDRACSCHLGILPFQCMQEVSQNRLIHAPLSNPSASWLSP